MEPQDEPDSQGGQASGTAGAQHLCQPQLGSAVSSRPLLEARGRGSWGGHHVPIPSPTITTEQDWSRVELRPPWETSAGAGGINSQEDPWVWGGEGAAPLSLLLGVALPPVPAAALLGERDAVQPPPGCSASARRCAC